MPSRIPRAQLVSDLELLTRVERIGGVRELAATALRVDDWVDYDSPLPAAAGFSSMGHPLGRAELATAWLVAGAEVVLLGPTGEVRRVPLPDADLDWADFAVAMRPVLVRKYLGGQELASMDSITLQPAVADLFALAWEADPAGRAAIFALIEGAMAPTETWAPIAVRLKGGFERGLNDRSPDVRRISTRALVAMASGGGPRPPVGEPWRMLYVLFAVPEVDVHREALAALAEIPDQALEELLDRLEDILRDAIAHDDAEVRRMAADLRLRLHAEAHVSDLAGELTGPNRVNRLQALKRLAVEPAAARDLLPHVLEAVTAPGTDEPTRAAAVSALRPLIDADPHLRGRVLKGLLTNHQPDALGATLGLLTVADLASDELRTALEGVLGRAGSHIDDIVTLLASYSRDRGVTGAVEGLTDLLHHPVAAVRLQTMAYLARSAPDRPALRSELLQPLAEHLSDLDPEVRLAAARAIVALDYPQAGELVAQLAFDPDRRLRREAVLLIPATLNAPVVNRVAALARDVNTLYELAPDAGGDSRLNWLAALHRLDDESSPRVTSALAAVLAAIPPDTADPFLSQAIEELDGRLIERTGGGEGLLHICRHLLEDAEHGGEHAARLAGAVAHASPGAADFLWTLYSEASGARAEAARRALAALGERGMDSAVREELNNILRHTDDEQRRDVLRTLLKRGEGGH